MLMAFLAVGAAIQFRLFDNLELVQTTILRVLDEISEFFMNGFEAVFAKPLNPDPSTASRERQIAFSLETITLWGAGYLANQTDFPLLEAFHDLGLVGGLFYYVIFLLLPLRVSVDLLLNGDPPPAQRLAVGAFLVILPRVFLGGTPYLFTTAAVMIFFYAVAVRYWSQTRAGLATQAPAQAVPDLAG